MYLQTQAAASPSGLSPSPPGGAGSSGCPGQEGFQPPRGRRSAGGQWATAPLATFCPTDFPREFWGLTRPHRVITCWIHMFFWFLLASPSSCTPRRLLLLFKKKINYRRTQQNNMAKRAWWYYQISKPICSGDSFPCCDLLEATDRYSG